MRDLPEIWVLRHGETEWNRSGRLQGHLDSPLTAKGVAQAKAQNTILRRVLPDAVSVLSSPSPRALRTAEIAVEGLGLNIDTMTGLMEIDLGDWAGKTVDEIASADVGLDMDRDPHLWKFHAPGGENLVEMRDRVEAVLGALTGPTVLVTHGVTSRLLRCLVLGLPEDALSAVPGGQGNVYHLADGEMSELIA